MKKALNNKEAREILEPIKETYGLTFSKKDKIETDENIILVNNEPAFFRYEAKIIPTLKLIQKSNFLRKITVDMGAVPFVIKGADIMRPGIVKIDGGIAKDEAVSVVDVNHGKVLSVCLAMFPGEEMQEMKTGKVLRNVHYVGDKVWNYY